MAGRCGCAACARYGAYVQLLHSAQADTDPARSQAAHAHLARIGPMAGTTGADGHCPGDTLAAPVLARLYPPDPAPAASGQPTADDKIAAIMAAAQARAQAMLDDFRAQAYQAAGLTE